MIACTVCQRPRRADAHACPFCAAPPPGRVAPLLRAAGALLTPFVLSACYGAPGVDIGWDTARPDTADRGETDTDTGASDCAPEDPAVGPDQPELCDDGIDNDCDGRIDSDDDVCI